MGTERRAYTRHALRWDAQLKGPDFGPWPLEIRDACEGGLFLAPVGQTTRRAMHRGARIDTEVSIRFEDPGHKTRFDCRGRIARSGATGIGIAFKGEFPKAVAALMDISRKQREAMDKPEAPRTQGRQPSARSALAACKSIVDEYFQQRLDNFLAHAGEAVFEAAGEIRDHRKQIAYFEAQKLLRARQSELTDGLKTTLVGNWGKLGRYRTPDLDREATEEDELSLVDDQEFEDWLARSELITRAESRSIRRLRLLEQRLSHLTGEAVDETTDPLSPAAVCTEFALVVRRIGLDHGPLQVIYPVFGRVVLEHIALLYDALNAQLRSKGVLPDLEQQKPEIRRLGYRTAATPRRGGNDQTATDAGAIDHSGDGGTPSNGPSGPGRSAFGGLYSGLRDLMGFARRLNTRSGPTAEQSAGEAAAAPGPAFETGEILGAVDQLQSQSPPPAQGGAATLKERLVNVLRSTDGGKDKHLAPDQLETVDVVDQWFGELEDGRAGAAFLKRWASRLAVLALRVQLQDQGFLDNREHPIHKLIDGLDEAGAVMADAPTKERASMESALDNWWSRRSASSAKTRKYCRPSQRKSGGCWKNRCGSVKRIWNGSGRPTKATTRSSAPSRR